MIVNKNKQYRTRDGHEVRIYATDGEVGAEVHGAFKTKDGIWIPTYWDIKGVAANDGDYGMFLMMPGRKIKREIWLNIEEDSVEAFRSKEDADQWPGCRIACVKRVVDCEEGEGL